MKKGKLVAGVWGRVWAMAVAVAGGWMYFNRQWVEDLARGMSYAPTEEMAKIRDSLGLTERGEFLFKATRPELNNEREFNQNCRGGTETEQSTGNADGGEVALLGCYRDGDIYIYNIEAPELAGIVETTTAHELLHAVFARMSEPEREELRPSLEKVLSENKWILEEDLKNYAEGEKFGELYVRVGTEIKQLPEDLEKHYGEIFQERAKITEFYDGYISIFRTLEQEMRDLESEAKSLGEEIEEKTGSYEQNYAQFSADVVSFNSCAAVAGCFKTTEEFNARREYLLGMQEKLDGEYEAVNRLIEEYNRKVEAYNNDVIRGKGLNRMINSNRKNEMEF